MNALSTVKTMLGDASLTDAEITAYLDFASAEILSWSYGPDTELTEVPDWLVPVQVMAVVTAINQRGGEGETSENVDGVMHVFKHDTMVSYIHAHAPGYAKLI